MKKLGWTVGVLVMVSCGFPRPADVGDDDAGPMGESACQLTAIGPSLANTGDTITLEGTFVDSVMVNFPGGASVAGTVLGPHRAQVSVPAAATAGDLTVETCGSTLGRLPFRRASFALGLGAFVEDYEQTAGARQYPTLAAPRNSHTSVIIGHHLYVLGGVGGTGALNSVEHALVNADGSLGRFAVVPDVSLVTPRQAHTTAVIGNQLYMVGGFGNGSLSSVEHATIAPDGSVGPFTIVPNVTLMTARQAHTSAVVGDYLYVLGGLGTSTLNSVERAFIHADGSLGPFATVTDTKLVTARHGHATVVIGNYLYVLGGAGNTGVLRDIERASINADGSLGPFSAASGTMLTDGRSGHVTELIGHYLYVLGGVGGSGSLATIERAAIDADGALGAFEPVSELSMVSRRHGHTSSMVGNYLYVLGGSDDIGLIPRGEHAAVNISGSLGPSGIVPGVTLTTGRADHVVVVLGSFFYVIGGINGGTAIERAIINTDGTLGPFDVVAGITLARPRDGATAAVIGSYLYILGGSGQSIERSSISADGSLGPFEIISVILTATRRGSTSSIIGNNLYIIGGTSPSDAVDNIEEAIINADGSLGGFGVVSGLNATARAFHTSEVVGSYLYVMGGDQAATGDFLFSVERAPTSFGRALGQFETVSNITLSTRNPLTVVVGSYLYALGIDANLERAVISANVDNPLEPFVGFPDASGTSQSGAAAAAIGNYLYVVGGAAGRVLLNTVTQRQLN